jgi:hypothetical protein
MMYPLEQLALSQARHSQLLLEAEKLRLLAKLPKSPSRLQVWTGSGLIWVGARLVDWGIEMALANPSQGVEVIG